MKYIRISVIIEIKLYLFNRKKNNHCKIFFTGSLHRFIDYFSFRMLELYSILLTIYYDPTELNFPFLLRHD